MNTIKKMKKDKSVKTVYMRTIMKSNRGNSPICLVVCPSMSPKLYRLFISLLSPKLRLVINEKLQSISNATAQSQYRRHLIGNVLFTATREESIQMLTKRLSVKPTHFSLNQQLERG